MGTCDTCRYWIVSMPWKIEIMRDGKLCVEEFTSSKGECHCPALNLYYNIDHAGHEYSRNDGMMCLGDGKFHNTSPKFGCIHHSQMMHEADKEMDPREKKIQEFFRDFVANQKDKP